MSQPNVRSEANAESRPGRGGIAAKSREAAELVEGAVADRVDQVRSQADSAQEHAVERIRRVAGHLRQMSDTLREEDALAANIAERTSRSVESIADYVRSADPQGIIRDTERLARHKPALFFGGAFVLGLAAGRFLKSSRPEGDQGRSLGMDSGGWDAERARASEPRERGDQRDSGFFANPPSPGSPAVHERRSVRSEDRFQQNYDAAFGRDVLEPEARRSSGASARSSGAAPAREEPSAPTTGGGLRKGSGA